jgi:hypothetical protein
MKDFTLKTYRLLLEALKKKNYTFVTFGDYLKSETSDDKSQKSEVKSRRSDSGDRILRQAPTMDKPHMGRQDDKTPSPRSEAKIPTCRDIPISPYTPIPLSPIPSPLCFLSI